MVSQTVGWPKKPLRRSKTRESNLDEWELARNSRRMVKPAPWLFLDIISPHSDRGRISIPVTFNNNCWFFFKIVVGGHIAEVAFALTMKEPRFETPPSGNL